MQTSAGLYVKKASGVLPLTDFLQVEAAGSNACVLSQAIEDMTWSKAAITVMANTDAGPDGAATADTLIDVIGMATCPAVQQTTAISYTVGLPYTQSFIVKPKTTNWVQIAWPGAVSPAYANFNIATGAVGSNSGNLSTSARLLGNGWCLISATVSAIATTSARPVVFALLDNADSAARLPTYNPSGARSVALWLAQNEQAPAPSSPMLSGASAASRAANAITVQRTGVSRIVFTFDDDSQQIVTGINTAAQYTIPTSLNRRLIKRMVGYAP
ncbi:hypothetical protein [Tardiphaga sp.]|uniref:phage head spike fiber domain-containing protein n=1 Tax=Tardiphaga sp. TaxID=1926292 RepID=UPI0037DA3C9D